MAWGLEHISSAELAEWSAYSSIEPFGGERSDLQAGIISATLANVNRDPEKHKDPFTPYDFMADFTPDKTEDQSGEGWESMLAKAEALNAAFGGLDLRNQEGSK